jgi:hypothetical protein
VTTLKEIRDRADAATKGPWHWAGNTDTRWLALCYWEPGAGRCQVMDFTRWGMQSATPRFGRDLMMYAAHENVVYEVAPTATSRADRRVYRADITGIRHPDAEFIVNSRQDIDALLAIIDAVETVCAKHENGATRWENPLPVPEWISEIRAALDGKQTAEVTA